MTGATRSDVMGGVGAATLVAVAVVPTSMVDGSPALCPFRASTGLPCPLCGMTRSVVHTMHGDIIGAIELHPGGPAFVLGLVVMIGLAASRRIRKAPSLALPDGFVQRAMRLALVAFAVFGAVRLGVNVAA